MQRVYAATLTGDRDLRIAPGGSVEFTHLLTNTGNGSDLFCLSIETLAGSSAFTTTRLVYDRNANGLIDTADAILANSTGAVAALVELGQDESANFIVEGAAPSGATLGDIYGATLVARAQEETGNCVAASVTDIGADSDGAPDTNNDRATVVNDAILRLTKSATYVANGAGADDDQITYTLLLKNIGLSAASTVTIDDAVPAGAAFSRRSNSANSRSQCRSAEAWS